MFIHVYSYLGEVDLDEISHHLLKLNHAFHQPMENDIIKRNRLTKEQCLEQVKELQLLHLNNVHQVSSVCVCVCVVLCTYVMQMLSYASSCRITMCCGHVPCMICVFVVCHVHPASHIMYFCMSYIIYLALLLSCWCIC